MADTAAMMETIKSMTVLELSDFVKQLQEEFGVSAAAPAAAAPAAGGGDAAPAADAAPTSFNVMLMAAGDKKINVIKVVREITALGLQAFLTGADRALFSALEGRAQGVHVRDGALEPA